MPTSDKERKAAERQRNKDAQLLRRELLVHPSRLDDFEKIRNKFKKPLRDRSQSG